MLDYSKDQRDSSNYSLSLPPIPFNQDNSYSTIKLPPLDKSEIDTRELGGNPKVGNLDFICQVHCRYNETAEGYRTVGRYQWEILKYLESKDFKHIFVEGLVHTWTLQNTEDRDACGSFHFNLTLPNHLRRLLESPEQINGKVSLEDELRLRKLVKSPEHIIEKVAELFSKQGQTPTNDQLLCLGNLGAHFVYACTHPDVTIHRSIPADEDNRLHAIQQRILKVNKRNGEHDHLFKLLRDRFREDYAIREISQFFKENPGETAVLIYGIYHQMDRARDRHFTDPPRMNVISFPRAFDQWKTTPVGVLP